MEPKKYLLSYDWKEGRDGHFFFHDHFETDSFIKFLCKFVLLSIKYEIIDVQYRNFKD